MSGSSALLSGVLRRFLVYAIGQDLFFCWLPLAVTQLVSFASDDLPDTAMN